MVCRTTRIGSAITSFARLQSGLEDQQTLSAFHDLLREGRTAPTPTAAQQNALIDEQIAAVNADPSLRDSRRRSLIVRLEEARDEQWTGAQFHAASHVHDRTQSARRAFDAYVEQAARDLGVSEAQVRRDISTGMTEAERAGRGTTAPREWREQFIGDLNHRDLPFDRQTAYALHQIEERRAATRAAAPTRPTVTRQRVNSSAIREVGYDPATGRLEVVLNSSPDRVYPYRVPQAVYDEMMASGSIGSYYARHVRNGNYRYADAAEAGAAGTQTQCRTCGQFAGPGHACPPRDSVEERNRTERLARENARARRTLGEVRDERAARASYPFPPVTVTTPAATDNQAESRTDGADYDERVQSLMDITGMTRGDAQAVVEGEDLIAARNAVRARLTSVDDGAGWETSDGRTFRHLSEATTHELNLPTPGATGAGVENCPTCGQFSGDGHVCPTADRVRELMERGLSRQRAEQAVRLADRATELGSVAAAEEEAAEAATNEPVAAAAPTNDSAQARREVRMETTTQRTYLGDSGSFRAPNLSAVQQEARRQGTVSMRVVANVRRVAGEDGESLPVARGRISGRVNVEYLGRGRGYRATGVTEPGDSGNDQLRCNCADYQRNYDCVHVRQAVQDINNRINQDRLRDRHAIGTAVQQVNADLAQDRAESVAAQETSRTTWGAPEVTYAEDMAAFQADYNTAKARRERGEEPVEYMTENATDGLGDRNGGRGFGVEIEFDVEPGHDRATVLRNIGRDLHAAGLTAEAGMRGYHAADRRGYTDQHRGGWSFESDATVAGEIVSPIMYDEPETWENLQKVCEIVKRNGGIATTRTGGHVHVSAHNYDHTPGNHTRLMAMFRENEDLIYRLSSNPDRGTHRGPRWCAPNSVPTDGYRSVEDARWRNEGHNYGVNMQSMHGRASDHVEFRTWDQTLNPSVIQAQIKVSLAMTEAAFRDADHTPTATSPLGSHRAHNRSQHGSSRRLTGDSWQADTEPLRKFADRLFRRRADKAQLASLFAVTKWQKAA